MFPLQLVKFGEQLGQGRQRLAVQKDRGESSIHVWHTHHHSPKYTHHHSLKYTRYHSLKVLDELIQHLSQTTPDFINHIVLHFHHLLGRLNSKLLQEVWQGRGMIVQ